MLRRDLRKLLCDGLRQQIIGDDPDLIGRHERLHALHRVLDHGAVAVERQHLLRLCATAARPEACSASARQNHCGKFRPVLHRAFSRVCCFRRSRLAQLTEELANPFDALVDDISRHRIGQANMLVGSKRLTRHRDNMRLGQQP